MLHSDIDTEKVRFVISKTLLTRQSIQMDADAASFCKLVVIMKVLM